MWRLNPPVRRIALLLSHSHPLPPRTNILMTQKLFRALPWHKLAIMASWLYSVQSIIAAPWELPQVKLTVWRFSSFPVHIISDSRACAGSLRSIKLPWHYGFLCGLSDQASLSLAVPVHLSLRAIMRATSKGFQTRALLRRSWYS